MSPDQIKSTAFQLATLKSESYRVLSLLILLGGLMIFVLARGLTTGRIELMLVEALVLGLIILYKLFRLSNIKRSLAKETIPSQATWAALGILIETQIPTLALFISIAGGFMNSEQIIVAPAMLIYFFFIILSTLRLSPLLSAMTGLLSALGYLAVALYEISSFPGTNTERDIFPLGIHFVYATFILAGGLAAAFVAGQIREHVATALREAAAEAAMKIELDRVSHDLDIARSIQQGLFPAKAPVIDSFDIAGWNQPADQTGGDYFDWQELPDGRIAISLADATGHGIGPALVGTSCRAYARASLLAGEPQEGVLSLLNVLLAEDLESNRFVTFAVIFLDPLSSYVNVLSAGHDPVLWYKYASDRVERLEAQGIPLGMMSGIGYDKGTEGLLECGDILAIVTDGFSEWENPEGEEFGVARLENVLRSSKDRTAAEIIIKFRTELATFCKGTVQKDDLTAVILKRAANGSSDVSSLNAIPEFSAM